MIETFEGRIGGGKTITAVLRAMAHWINSGIVCTNIDLNWIQCKQYADGLGYELDDRQLVMLGDGQISEFWKHTPTGTRESPVLVIIDEADVWVGNQTTGVKVDAEFLRFLKQSRKMSTDIIFITQALKNLHTQISRLNQHVWRFRDMRKWRVKDFGIEYPFPHILQQQFDYDGKTALQRRFWTIDEKLFPCYNTDAIHGGTFDRLNDFDKTGIAAKRKHKGKQEIPMWCLLAALAFVILCALLAL